MPRIRRLAVLVLGLWLGAAVFADVAVTRNFTTVDRFLSHPGSAAAESEVAAIGKDRARDFLRRNAGEENNALFRDWEWTELVIGGALIALLIPAPSGVLNTAIASSMFVLVAIQRLALSSRIAEIGRLVPSLSPGDPVVTRFWTLHGIYSGIEILKLAIGFVLAGRLTAAARVSHMESGSHLVSVNRNG